MIEMKTFSEELGYLVDAIINTGEISSFDSDKTSGNTSEPFRQNIPLLGCEPSNLIRVDFNSTAHLKAYSLIII